MKDHHIVNDLHLSVYRLYRIHVKKGKLTPCLVVSRLFGSGEYFVEGSDYLVVSTHSLRCLTFLFIIQRETRAQVDYLDKNTPLNNINTMEIVLKHTSSVSFNASSRTCADVGAFPCLFRIPSRVTEFMLKAAE